MKRIVCLYLLTFCYSSIAFAQVSAVNLKGTKVAIDSSKWSLSGSHIYNKNAGNVGLGNPSPTYKLDVTGKVRVTDSFISKTVLVQTLNTGTINDSLVVADPSTGILKRINSNRFVVNANNGLTKVVDSVQLGGALTKNTIIAQAANKLQFTSTSVDGFSVDGTTFSVDGNNNRIGIGTNTPNKTLEISSGVSNTSGVRMTSLTSTSPASVGTPIGVNVTGDIVTLPASYVYRLTTAASSTSTTRVNVSDLSFAITAGKNYRVQIIGTYQTALTTTGGSMGFVLPTGTGSIAGIINGEIALPTTLGLASGLRSTLRAVNNVNTTAGSFLTTSGVGAANTPHFIGGEFILICSASGTFQVQWGSEVGSSAAQLNVGCTMFVTEY
jgi:hypothetical protein